jgi:hypothetical protein
MRYIKAIPVVAAMLVGGFLAVASAVLDWSSASTLVVGVALVAMLGLFGTPLLLLDFEGLASQARSKRRLSEIDDFLSGQTAATNALAATGAFEGHLERQRIAPSKLELWHSYPHLGPNQPRPTASQLALTWGESRSSNRPSDPELPVISLPQQAVFVSNPKTVEFVYRPDQVAIEPAVG